MSETYTCPGCGGVSDFSAGRCPYCQNPFAPALGSSIGLSKDDASVRKLAAQLEAKIAKSPNDGNSCYALGEAYHHLGDYKKAQEQLQRAAQLLPNKAEVFYLLAWNSGMKQGWESVTVAENARKALALNPEFPQAEALLHLSKGVQSYLFQRSDLDHLDAALNEFRRVIELDPRNTYGYYYAASVYEMADEMDHALECFEKAAELSTDDIAPSKEDARIFARAGFLYYKLGQRAPAKKFLTDARNLDPDNSAVQEILSSLSDD